MTIPEETKHYTSRKYATREQWLAGRAESVGASEVSLVMGIAPAAWGTALDLWERKRKANVAEGGNADTARGSAAEEHIRELLRIESGLEVHDMTGRVFRSRRFPWLTCSLDAAIAHDGGAFTVSDTTDRIGEDDRIDFKDDLDPATADELLAANAEALGHVKAAAAKCGFFNPDWRESARGSCKTPPAFAVGVKFF